MYICIYIYIYIHIYIHIEKRAQRAVGVLKFWSLDPLCPAMVEEVGATPFPVSGQRGGLSASREHLEGHSPRPPRTSCEGCAYGTLVRLEDMVCRSQYSHLLLCVCRCTLHAGMLDKCSGRSYWSSGIP